MTTVLAVIALIVALAALALSGQRFLRVPLPGPRVETSSDRRRDHEADDRDRTASKLEGAVRQLAANYLCWGCALIGLAVAWLLLRGRIGRAFRAVRDSEIAATSSGVNLAVYKTVAFGISAALLDGNGDGVVITSINGRQDTRCYAKQVENWTSIHNLSDEERQAIREALGKAEHRTVARAR